MGVQVLVRLGTDPNDVRQQVIRLLHDRPGGGPAGATSRMGKRARAGAIEEAIARMAGSVERRLTAIERWVGLTPDVGDLDQEIAAVRREKESAIDGQDFETAAALRDNEKALLASKASREQKWTATAASRLSLAADLSRVNAELERLRAILRQHGIEPDDGAA